MFTISLKSVGNPDQGQYAAPSEPLEIEAVTLSELIDQVREYADYWNLGAGNWMVPEIRQDAISIGRLAYNLKLLAV